VLKIIGSLATVAAAGVLTFAALPVASASAGSNGQELSICAASSQDRVMIWGKNQDGVDSYEEMSVTPGVCQAGKNVTWNWWWKGDVQISFTTPDQNGFQSRICWDVPERQSSDFFKC
jgi:hypothetical protein